MYQYKQSFIVPETHSSTY